MRSSGEPFEAHQTKASVQPESSREAAPPPMSPAQFNALSKKRMIGVLKRVGLGKGRSKARKDVLEAAYRTWYEGRTAAEPTSGVRESVASNGDANGTGTTDAANETPATTSAVATVSVKPDPAPAIAASAVATVSVKPEPAAAKPISVPPPWVNLPEPAAPLDSSSAPAPTPQGSSAPPAAPAIAPPAMMGTPPVGTLLSDIAAAVLAQPAPVIASTEPEPASDELHLDFASDRPPKSEDERRGGKRVELEIDIGYRSETNFYVGFSTDLSDGGLFVATVEVLPVGTPVNVYFVLPGGGDISAEGVVAWVRQSLSFSSEMYSGFGVRFTRLSRRDRDAIEHFMSVREPLFYVD